MNQGIFISIEGTDGSGKTTQIKMIKQYLEQKSFDVIVVREPGGTVISEKIRSIILDTENNGMGNITEMLLYASSRAQLVNEIIKPAIKNGKVVICDRFVDSSYVYQGFGRGIDLDIVETINKIALDNTIPDLTMFFDIDPECALKRRVNATATDRIEREKIDFHVKVYNGYKKLLQIYPERIKRIDASRNIEEIFSDVRHNIDEVLYRLTKSEKD